jgi:hypothetical protein
MAAQPRQFADMFAFAPWRSAIGTRAARRRSRAQLLEASANVDRARAAALTPQAANA